jgi:hypothetical protein
LYHFLVVCHVFFICGCTFIGDEAECEHSHATVTSHDNLIRSAHACNNKCTRIKRCLITIASAKFCQTYDR